MTTILIDPILVKSQNGTQVEIYGIDPADHDCIHGRINGKQYRWNKSGICRDSIADFNISPTDSDVKDVIETIDKIGG